MARSPLFVTPSMYLFRKSMSKGIFGDSRLWKTIAFVIIGRRMLRKILGSEPQTVAVERLGPGQTLILRGVTGRSPKRR